MQGIGVGCLILGYCAWYTLYQKVAGDGSGFLFNLTGSSRFQVTGKNVNTQQQGGVPTTGPGGAPTPVVPGTPVIVK